MTSSGQKAFTLIELMVAMTLGFAVIAAAYAALSASVEGSRRIDGFVEESSTIANLTDTIKRQLANAYYDAASDLSPVFIATPPDQTAGATGAVTGAVWAATGAAGTGTPVDMIAFSFAWRGTLAEADPQFPYYTVTYFIADATGDSPGGLSRRITPLWPRDVEDEPEDELIAPEVRGLGLAYFDGTAWTNTWDAATAGLPRAVRIDLYVDSERFGKDPYRTDAAAPQRLELYHTVAWLPATVTPATTAEGTNASGG